MHKKQDYKRKQVIDDFLILWHEEVPTVINRKAVEDQIKYKRQNKVIIPSKQDIKLYDYLRKQCEKTYNDRLQKSGILDKNVNPDLYEKLSKESQQYAKRFARIIIRAFQMQIKKNIYLRACPLIRKFSRKSSATIPSSLQGIMLRKQIATYTAMLNIEDTRRYKSIISLILWGMPKKYTKVTQNIYRIPVPIREVTDISRLLEAAMGNDLNENENEDCNNIFDTDSVSQLNVISEEFERNIYIPESDNKNNIEGSSTDANRSSYKSHNTSLYGKTKRIRWSGKEKNAISKHFGNIFTLSQLPSLKDCQNAINKYKCLKKRQPQYIKSWIDTDQRRVDTHHEAYQISKN
ncbi:hypothetical protein ACFW04_011770 [Cataglyphis niger]